MIDLHCHIASGVDDGAQSLEESRMMAKMAFDSGVRALALTPHFNLKGRVGDRDIEMLCQSMIKLHKALSETELPLKLYTGMELFAAPNVPELVKENKVLTLGGSRYLLIEFARHESAQFADELLGELMRMGKVPVIAHPERYKFIQSDRAHLLHWIDCGYIIQLNKGSVLGGFGREVSDVAHWCLDEGYVHFLASDAHSPYRRTTNMAGLYEYIAEYNSPSIARFLLEENPASILADAPIKAVCDRF